MRLSNLSTTYFQSDHSLVSNDSRTSRMTDCRGYVLRKRGVNNFVLAPIVSRAAAANPTLWDAFALNWTHSTNGTTSLSDSCVRMGFLSCSKLALAVFFRLFNFSLGIFCMCLFLIMHIGAHYLPLSFLDHIVQTTDLSVNLMLPPPVSFSFEQTYISPLRSFCHNFFEAVCVVLSLQRCADQLHHLVVIAK